MPRATSETAKHVWRFHSLTHTLFSPRLKTWGNNMGRVRSLHKCWCLYCKTTAMKSRSPENVETSRFPVLPLEVQVIYWSPHLPVTYCCRMECLVVCLYCKQTSYVGYMCSSVTNQQKTDSRGVTQSSTNQGMCASTRRHIHGFVGALRSMQTTLTCSSHCIQSVHHRDKICQWNIWNIWWMLEFHYPRIVCRLE